MPKSYDVLCRVGRLLALAIVGLKADCHVTSLADGEQLPTPHWEH